MLDVPTLDAVLAALADERLPAERRRRAERQLEGLIEQLLDAKVLHSFSDAGSLEGMVELLLRSRPGLSATGRLLRDRFRYRLAHVAMRSRQWELAEALLNQVLAGDGELTRARLYLCLCRRRGQGEIPPEDLASLLDAHRADLGQKRPRPPLDGLIQDPTTNLLELLLLSQDAPASLFDQLYDPRGRHRTTEVRLRLQAEGGPAVPVSLSEWLAEAQLEEYRREGWLVVDCSVSPLGTRGRGSRLRAPGGNIRAPVLIAVAQILAEAAPAEIQANLVQDRLRDLEDDSLIPPEGREPAWERVTSAVLSDQPGRRVFERITESRGAVTWRLQPPYVVVLRDSSSLLRQAAGRSQ